MKRIYSLITSIVVVTMAMCNAQSLSQSPLTVSSGNLQRLEIFSSEMEETMKVDIWTPDGYSNDVKYQVVYMHDGQNLFDASSTWNHQAWEIDSVAAKLIDDGKIFAPIVVGIHSVDTTRLGDLMPEKPLKYLTCDTVSEFIIEKMCRGRLRADEYLAFIVNTLKPYIDSNYSTNPTMEATSIMGSSMGGLISIYGMAEYPETFGAAACLSTHWSGTIDSNADFPNAMIRYLGENLPRDNRHYLYMDNGDCPIDSRYTPHFNRINKIAAEEWGIIDGRLLTRYFPGASHCERDWSQRVEIPLIFLLNR